MGCHTTATGLWATLAGVGWFARKSLLMSDGLQNGQSCHPVPLWFLDSQLSIPLVAGSSGLHINSILNCCLQILQSIPFDILNHFTFPRTPKVPRSLIACSSASSHRRTSRPSKCIVHSIVSMSKDLGTRNAHLMAKGTISCTDS